MATQQLQFNPAAGTTPHDGGRQDYLVKGLGWFSIGLGLAEIAAPDKMARLIGLRDEDRRRTILRVYGLREIAAGVGILSGTRPTGWLWGRVAGDALDLSSLGSAFRASDADRSKLLAATAAVAGVTAVDVMCAQKLSRNETQQTEDTIPSITKTIIVNRPPDEVYRFWHDLENLSTFLDELESVRVTGSRTSRWKLRTATGKKVQWEAEIIDDQPDSRISWRTLPGSDVDNSGSITFERAPGGRGTLVRVDMQYAPPGGVPVSKIMKLLGKDPAQQVQRALYAFKQLIETGEITQSDASIHPGMHPGRPPKR